MNNLQQALLNIEEERIHKYEDMMDSMEQHEFSDSYMRRRREIIDAAKTKSFARTAVVSPRRAHRLRLRTILVAALIMLLATVSVIAIAKPQIYYVIKEKLTHWDITFERENAHEIDEVVPVKPNIPEGFEIVEEDLNPVNYYLVLEDGEGRLIIYEQMLPEGTNIALDSERSDNSVLSLNGNDVIVSKEGNATMLICNDGDYIYHIRSTASEEIIWNMLEEAVK